MKEGLANQDPTLKSSSNSMNGQFAKTPKCNNSPDFISNNNQPGTIKFEPNTNIKYEPNSNIKYEPMS